MHLAAGMLAAGYQGVVATMWAIRDADAPGIAEEFYEYLSKERTDTGSQGLDSRCAAYALDHAIRRTREKHGDDKQGLLAWVPYVYFGL